MSHNASRSCPAAELFHPGSVRVEPRRGPLGDRVIFRGRFFLGYPCNSTEQEVPL
ncbi:hypothetical protein MSS4_03006 [Mycobacterium marinum]|nr:hypothetical protein DSM43519_03342 [Mycobacterium marinum]RFZ37505.1 hypothetical protein KST_02990 [Mycobacterium marinum]RFZ48429.1 hypothetical protein MSS4_03006 [Mycobacterium marinum]